jgi:hypothetical protein
MSLFSDGRVYLVLTDIILSIALTFPIIIAMGTIIAVYFLRGIKGNRPIYFAIASSIGIELLWLMLLPGLFRGVFES